MTRELAWLATQPLPVVRAYWAVVSRWEMPALMKLRIRCAVWRRLGEA